MTVSEFMFEWLEKMYGCPPNLAHWTPEAVVQFTEDYTKHIQDNCLCSTINKTWDNKEDSEWDNA